MAAPSTLVPSTVPSTTQLTPQQQHDCWLSYASHHDRRSRDRLFEHYKRWTEFEALRLYRQLSINGLELQEFQQWAFAGALEAIARFDLQHQVTFKAFAVHRVRGAILSALPQFSEQSAYYIGRGKYLSQNNLLSAQPTAGDNGEPVSELVSMVMSLSMDYLLSEPDSDMTQLSGTFYSSPEINAIGESIRDFADRLEEPMKSVISLYYFQGLSFDHIAQLLDLSNGRVSQLHKKAIGVLKKRLGW